MLRLVISIALNILEDEARRRAALRRLERQVIAEAEQITLEASRI